jgi:hypothetical protein
LCLGAFVAILSGLSGLGYAKNIHQLEEKLSSDVVRWIEARPV